MSDRPTPETDAEHLKFRMGGFTQTPELDPFPKWKWMMDYCKKFGVSPFFGWDAAKEAWKKANEVKL